MTRSEIWRMFECVRLAAEGRLGGEGVEWLLEDRGRAEYFEAVMWHVERLTG